MLAFSHKRSGKAWHSPSRYEAFLAWLYIAELPQACIREHIAYICKKPGSKEAFPGGVVSRDQIEHFLAHRHDADAPDHGCTADACCPNLLESSRSPWNITFVEAVTADFISKVSEDWYSEHELPPDSLVEKHVSSRVLVCLRSMIKQARRKAKLNTADKITRAKRHGKYMERRRVVSFSLDSRVTAY
jgi:hypothetical protein